MQRPQAGARSERGGLKAPAPGPRSPLCCQLVSPSQVPACPGSPEEARADPSRGGGFNVLVRPGSGSGASHTPTSNSSNEAWPPGRLRGIVSVFSRLWPQSLPGPGGLPLCVWRDGRSGFLWGGRGRGRVGLHWASGQGPALPPPHPTPPQVLSTCSSMIGTAGQDAGSTLSPQGTGPWQVSGL